MGGSFETSPDHRKSSLQPLRVPARAPEVYQEAKDMVADLPRWKLVSADDAALTLVCEREGGLFGAPARVTITVEGPEGIPSATVNVRSVSKGGLRARDRANVAEFLEPFRRRVG
jgi:hypothetical protein